MAVKHRSVLWLVFWLGCSCAGVSAAPSTGGFIQPKPDSQAGANLVLVVYARDDDGLARVAVSFNQSSQQLVLCEGAQCGGSSIQLTRTGVDPAAFGANGNDLFLQLWLTDQQNNQTQVAAVQLRWQGVRGSTVQSERLDNGLRLDVRWAPVAGMARYNVYLASVSGVNRFNFRQLPGGQARLAVSGTATNFTGLDPAQRYYLLLTGLSGSGEAVLAPEVLIPQLNQPANQQPQAQADVYRLHNQQTLQITASEGVLANDSDPDGDPLTVQPTPLSDVQAGTLLLQTDGSFSYRPNAGFVGTDQFVYQLQDSRGAVAQGQVSLVVSALVGEISGDSQQISGEFVYLGQGENPAGSQLGSGLYRIGDCVVLTETRCTMLGRYTESAQSSHAPGQQGNFAFIQQYPGQGLSPVLARSVSANSNSLQFISIGDARFELRLFPDSGGQFSSLFPATPFSSSLSFGAFIQAGAQCTGLTGGQLCSIGQVGRVNGASIRAPLDRLSFTIPAAALQDPGPRPPQAVADQYRTSPAQPLIVTAPGVLQNDSEAAGLAQGIQLLQQRRNSPALGGLVALAADEYRQQLYVYPAFGSAVQRMDRLGNLLGTLPRQGEAADDFDLDVAAIAFRLKDTWVPQGSLLLFNGETGPTEVYALDPNSGAVLSQLTTAFGDSHVVGGVLSSKTGTLWLLQDRVPGAVQGNRVAEIDPVTGQVLRSFSVTGQTPAFAISYGDLHINPHTGHLLLVSSIQSSIAEFSMDGELLRLLPLPAGVGNSSGLAISADGRRLWLASTSGDVDELGFAGQASLPTLLAQLVRPTQHGSLILKTDGSFSYTPNVGFLGEDSFSYRLRGAFGSSPEVTVVIDVR